MCQKPQSRGSTRLRANSSLFYLSVALSRSSPLAYYTMITERLPKEILLDIVSLLAKDSTLYLKPFTLLNRDWHTVAAPVLLSTISVSSLGGLVSLCEQITSSNNTLRSIETFTKTIVIDGDFWEDRTSDSYVGLEDVSDLPPRNEADGEPNEPDISMPPEQVLSIIHATVSRFVALDALEWYGRFAGDYHLVRYLQRAGVIRHMTYKIEACSNKSTGKR